MGNVLSSTLQINLKEDVTKSAPQVAAALDKMQREAAALQAALAKSGVSDKLQANLAKIGASQSHIEGVAKAWEHYAKAEGLAGKAAAEFTKSDVAQKRDWERIAIASVRTVMREEASLERARERQIRNTERMAERETRALQRESDKRRKLLEQESRRTDNTVAGVAALYAAHSAAHAAVKVGERYREFDKERRYAQVVMGATDAQMKPLIEQAIRGSANSKFNDVEWLAAQRSLAARGYKSDQVLGFTPTAALLGQAFDVSMEDGVKMFEGAMLGFRKKAGTQAEASASAKRTADLEVKASKISGMDANDVIDLYKRGAPAAQAAKLTEEQMLAFGAVSKKLNIGGDEAATAFIALTKNLQKPTHEAREAMRAAGINFGKYQRPGKALDEDGFAGEVAREYGVKLTSHVRAGLHRIFTNPKLMNDPDQFAPAVMRFLRGALGGKDAKSMKSIAGLAGRYRDASIGGIDTQGLFTAMMAALRDNPALGNLIFGSKQGGKITAALDLDTFKHMLDELENHSEGFAQKVSDARMTGFNGELSKLSNQVAILETSIGRAFDNDGAGGFLTNAAWASRKFVETLAEANPQLLRAGSEAVLLAGAFAALKGVDFFRNGFGLKTAATALDRSAVLLDEAAIALGAKRGADAAAAATASEGAGGAKAPAKGVFGEGGARSIPKKIVAGGPAAIAEYFAYQFGTGAIDQMVDFLPGGNDTATRAKMRDRGIVELSKDIWRDLFGGGTPIAGKRARGGPVGGGQSYLVGERGPEIFTAGASGQITSNGKLLAALDHQGDGAVADEVRYMGRELVNATDRVARAVASLRDGTSWNEHVGGDGGTGGGFSGGRRGFMARGGHFGGRRGFMAGGEPGVGAYGTPSKSLLDFIAQSEGTKGYNTSLGFGRYLPGGHETNLEGMSLNQILELGKYMRAQPGNPNSSALGRYQITGETIRDLMKRMHLKGDEKFDAKMQDAMATKLIQDEGPRALKRWASLKGARMEMAQRLLRAGSIASIPGGGPDGAGSSSSKAVDLARSMTGAGAGEAARALGHGMHDLWCADFVNGVLDKTGGKGTNSALAASFFKWGKQVSATEAKAGDIMVAPHHVGFATGPAQMHNGRMMVPMISGNHGHKVGESWEPVGKYQIRHGEDDPLGLRRKREQRQGDHVSMRGLSPAVDNQHLRETAALLDHIHHRMHGINVASARHRQSGGMKHIAGLGARTRGGFAGSGVGIG